MIKLNMEPNTPEWLEARKNYRTASEAAIVCGISPFTTPEKFKLIKAGLVKQYYNKAMADGHAQEEQIREWAGRELGMDFKEEVWVNGGYLASLDGIDGTTLVEIKNSAFTYNHLAAGHVEEHYWLQIQQQLFCSPAEVGYLVAHNPKTGQYAISELITPDPAAMVRIDDAWKVFDEMPMPEGDLNLDDNLDLLVLFERYATMKMEADDVKARMDTLKAQILAFSPERSASCRGHKVIYKKGATRVDYKKAATDAQLELAEYEKQGAPSYSINLAKSPFEAEDV